ncbi:hypothetical protein DPMN_024774 [Dreissena polymorpha]|uniref:Uncharacterized protein n=1 Tax=Dreissena polymorpha TaxID=45954 RepID=A0A9D4RBX9_DREPO|nr:hypothetical protein DPMN_024774 [Dreissena polymorpha]
MQGRPPPITHIFRINGEILVTNADKATDLVHHYQAVSSDEGYTQEFIERKLKMKEEFPAWLETHKQDENHNYNAPFSLFELETALLSVKMAHQAMITSIIKYSNNFLSPQNKIYLLYTINHGPKARCRRNGTRPQLFRYSNVISLKMTQPHIDQYP